MLMAELSFFICFPLSIGMEVWESRGGRRNLWKLNQTNSMRCMCVRVGGCECVCVCKKQISWPALCRVYNCNHTLSFQAQQRAALHTLTTNGPCQLSWPYDGHCFSIAASHCPSLPQNTWACHSGGLSHPPRPPMFHFLSPQAEHACYLSVTPASTSQSWLAFRALSWAEHVLSCC